MDPLRSISSTPVFIQQAFPPAFPAEAEAIPLDQVSLTPQPARRKRHGASARSDAGAPGQDDRQGKIENNEAAFVNSALNPKNRKYPDVREAIEKGLNKVQVMDQGVVEKVFPDDNQGIKHQLFTVRMGGKVIRIAHNYELAGRIPNLRPGLSIAVKGEFIDRDNMSAQMAEILGDGYFLAGSGILSSIDSTGIDGLIHWTHKPTQSNPNHEGGGIVILSEGADYHKVIS
jgi:hypothetical protein